MNLYGHLYEGAEQRVAAELDAGWQEARTDKVVALRPQPRSSTGRATGAAADRLFAPNTVNFGPSKKRKAAAEAAQMIQALIEQAATARDTAANTDKACPRCAEIIKGSALVCRFCGHHFDRVTPGGALDAKEPGVRWKAHQASIESPPWSLGRPLIL